MSATSMIVLAQSDNVAEALLNIPPFHDLPPAVRDIICENSDRRSYEAGQTVFSLGQYDGGEFFVVLKGRLRVSRVDAKTGAMVIEEFGPNSLFGLETALVEEDDSDCQQLAVTAEEELDLIAIDAASFRSLAGGRPSLMRNIAFYFARQLTSLRFQTSPAQAAPEQRVFAALLEYVERDAVSGKWHIQRMPKHRELADRAGVEESITANAVATLIQEGVAERDYPGLIVNDMQRLNQLAN